VSFYYSFGAWFMELEMARRGEPSLEDMLADPIVRDLMAADEVDPGELDSLLRTVRLALARRHSTRSDEKPNCFAGLVKLFTFTGPTNSEDDASWGLTTSH
jgi:hypothetical protein